MASARPQPTLELRKMVDAPQERVFRAWTDLDQIRKWWGPGGFTLPEARQDLREGGTYRFGMRAPDGKMHWLKGQYREIRPPERLVFTWNWDEDGAIPETVVTVQLIPIGKQTQVIVTHGPFPTEQDRNNHNMGWTSMLERLGGAA